MLMATFSGNREMVVRNTLIIPIILLISLVACEPKNKTINHSENEGITVAAYYFPNYHTDDPRNINLKGKGWSEWELVKAAQPRFPGDHQPNVPAWGYTDEKDPKVMAQKIDAAVDMVSMPLFLTGTCTKTAHFSTAALMKDF